MLKSVEETSQSKPIPQRFVFKATVLGLPFFLTGIVLFGLLFSPLHNGQKNDDTFSPVLSPNETAGQLFLAEYSNLNSISLELSSENPGNQPGAIRVTLRHEGPTGSEVFATTLSDLHGSGTISKTIAIPAQPDSAGKIYYVEVAGVEGSSWKLAKTEHNAYLEGSLYLNGQPQKGDLFFEAGYSANPIELLKHFFTRQQEWGGAPWLALFLVFGMLGWYLLGFFWYGKKLVSLPAGFSLKGSISGKRGFWIFCGYLLVLLALRYLSYSFINPPLQGPDEPGHLGRIISTAAGVPNETMNAPFAELMAKVRFPEAFPWLSYDDNTINLYPANAEFYQPGLYYTIAAFFVEAGRLFGQDLVYQIYLARAVSMLIGLATLVVFLVASHQLLKTTERIALLFPITMAMLPQVAHIGSVANNDNAALFFSSVAMLGMFLLFKKGLKVQYFVLLVAGLALSIASKRTGVAVLPAFALGFYILAWVRLQAKGRRILLGFTGITVICLIAGFMVKVDFNTAAKGWYVSPTFYGVHAPRYSEGYKSTTGLKLQDQTVEQAVDLLLIGEINQANFSFMARPLNNVEPATLKVTLSNYAGPVYEREFKIQGENWQEIKFDTAIPQVILRVPTSDGGGGGLFGHLTVKLSAIGDIPVLCDNISLTSLNDPNTNLIINSSFEESTFSARSDWQNGQPVRGNRTAFSDWLDLLGSGAPLNYGRILINSLITLFMSWWGVFGWIQVYMTPVWYVFWGVITTLVVAGLLRLFSRGIYSIVNAQKKPEQISPSRFFKPVSDSNWKPGFILFCLLSIFSAIVVQQAYMFFSLSYQGIPDLLVGRYLLVTLFPALFLLLTGLSALLPVPKSSAKNDEGAATNTETPLETGANSANIEIENKPKTGTVGVAFGAWGWAILLFYFDISALLGTIFPFYYIS